MKIKITLNETKLKQDNAKLATPLKFEKNDWKDITIELPSGKKSGPYSSKCFTISKGMVVGILDRLAVKLDLETVGEVQPKTELALKKIADKIVKDMEEEEKIKRSVKISMFLFNIGKKLAGVKPENKEIVRKELDTIANDHSIDSEKRVDLMNNIISRYS